MSPKRFNRRFVFAVLLLLSVSPSRAHGPYDHSSQLIVGKEQLNLVITLGADATRDFLARTELSADRQRALIMSSSSTPRELPLGVAARMFVITADGQPLSPQQVQIAFQGLETLFTLTYPRPAAAKLDLRALYFNGIEPMKRGTFLAFDEEFQSLGAANLSRMENLTQVLLPAASPAVVANVVGKEPAARAAATEVQPAGVTVIPPAKSQLGTFQLAVLALAILGATFLVWLNLRGRRGAPATSKGTKNL